MISFVRGDFFDYNADIRVNTVNCVGVMGAGVALQFKNRYPEMNAEYVKLCKKGQIRPGKPFVWESSDLYSDPKEKITIINFPTKDDWKKPSEYSYIEDGLKWLKIYLQHKPASTITIPALGCGHGGLDWVKVRDMIVNNLSELQTEILVFEPESSHIHDNLDKEKECQILQNQNIISIKSSESPILLGNSVETLYVKGDINILSQKTILLLLNKNSEEREFKAIIDSVNQLQTDDNVVYVLCLNSKIDSDLLKEMLILKKRMIVIIPTGILQLKLRKDIKEVWDNDIVTMISLFSPNQQWKNYSSIQSLRFALGFSKAILINTLHPDGLKYIEKDLSNRNTFYINYWTDKIPFFERIQAISIGRNSNTGLPNVGKILNGI